MNSLWLYVDDKQMLPASQHLFIISHLLGGIIRHINNIKQV